MKDRNFLSTLINMKKLLPLFPCFFLLSCSSNLVAPVNKDPLSINPKEKPKVNMTAFTDAVDCMGELIDATQTETRSFMIQNIANESGDKLAKSATTMLTTALSNMAKKSRKLEISGINTTAQALSSAKELQYIKPKYYIKGAISQSERNYSKKGVAVGLEGMQIATIDYEDTSRASAMALDLHLGEVKSMLLLPGVTSSNILALMNNSEEAGAGIALMEKAAVDFSMGYNLKEGPSAAIRNLIELGSIELIGKMLNLPYEECYRSEQSRIDVIKQYNDKKNNVASNSDSASIYSASNPTITSPVTIENQPSSLQSLGSLKVWTDKPSYKIGDRLQVYFKVDKPMFVNIISINPNGEKITYFPNPYQTNAYCEQGKTYTIPPISSDGEIIISAPTGTDKIRGFASNQKISESQLRISDGDVDEKYLNSSLSSKTSGKKFVKSILNISILR